MTIMRISALLWLATATASAGAAEVNQVQRAPVASWIKPSDPLPVPNAASGLMFMRRQDVQVHLSRDGQAQYLGYRVKLLQASALELGNIQIAWSPSSGAPIVHTIQIIRDGQTIDVLKGASFEILRREDHLEEAKLDGMLTAVLRVPDLRVGDELEVDMTTFSRDPNLGQHSTGILHLADSPSPGRYHLGLSWDTGHKPFLKTTPDMQSAMQTSDRGVDFKFDNPAIVSPPSDAPPRYLLQRAVEFSDFRNWSEVSAHFAPLYVKAAKLSSTSSLHGEVKRIAALSTPLERASAALKLVQQNVRYIYVGLDGGNLTPASADETWQRRYGDCKGKTALLLALLTELGIEAQPVLVSSSGADDGLNERLPVIQYFDHVLVRARINGTTYWLDGTLPAVAAPSFKPVYPLRWVLPLSPQGNPLEKLDWQMSSVPDELSLYELDARAGFDKPAKIVTTQIVRGVKGLLEEVAYSAVTPAQLLAAFRQRAIGETFQKIDDVQWRYDQKAKASILTISGTGTVHWDDDGKGARSLALPGGGFSPPDRRIRAAAAGDGAPFYSKPEYVCHVTTVRLPSFTEAKQWSSKPSFDTRIFGRNYHRAFELRDGTIRMVGGSRIEQPEISAADARRDNDRIADFDNSMGYVFYDPTSKSAAVGKGEKVPATFDFDWTGNDVPCTSSAKSLMVASAHIAGASTRRQRVASRAKGSLVGLFSSDDYPNEALRTNQTGTVSVELTIGTDGRVSDCRVKLSSLSPTLDAATCKVLTERARFEPALDRAGRPVSDHYSQRITWKIPQSEPQPVGGLKTRLIVVRHADGRLECTTMAATQTPAPAICDVWGKSAEKGRSQLPMPISAPYRATLSFETFLGRSVPAATNPAMTIRGAARLVINQAGRVTGCQPIAEALLNGDDGSDLCSHADEQQYEALPPDAKDRNDRQMVVVRTLIFELGEPAK
jgi:TonB family protein